MLVYKDCPETRYLGAAVWHEIFGSGVLTQIRSVSVGDLGTRPKIQNLGLKTAILYFLALSPAEKFKRCRRSR